MMEKSAQPGEGGGCTPTPFHYIYITTTTITNKVVVYLRSSWEGSYTPILLLYPHMYLVTLVFTPTYNGYTLTSPLPNLPVAKFIVHEGGGGESWLRQRVVKPSRQAT